MIKQWCDCQMKCKEDTDDTWTCCAHLAEGLAFQCRFNPQNVHLDKDGNYELDRCPDFEPPGYNRNGLKYKKTTFILSRDNDGCYPVDGG